MFLEQGQAYLIILRLGWKLINTACRPVAESEKVCTLAGKSHVFRYPLHVNFTDPESEGLPGSRNFYLESEPGVRLGVWQILPQDLQVILLNGYNQIGYILKRLLLKS